MTLTFRRYFATTLILFGSLFPSLLFSQTKNGLTLQQCIELERKNGPNAKIARNNFRSRTFSYRSFNDGLLPQILLSGTVPDYSRSIIPVIQPDGTTQYVAQSQANSTMSLSVNQPLIFTGGTLFASSSLSRNDLIGNISTSTLWSSSPFVLGLRQPLFQLNTLWWDNKANELQSIQAIKKFNEDMEDAGIDATQKFFDAYVASMRVDNANLNVEINDSLLTVSRGRYKVGKIDENDLLQGELALANAQNNLATVKLDYTIALRALATSLGLSENEVPGIIPPEELPDISVNATQAIEEAHRNRSDLVAYQLQHQNAERNLRNQELTNGFNATVTASFGYNQTAPVLNNVYHNLLNQQAARLDLSIPLLQWGKGSNAIGAAKEQLYEVETSIDLQQKSFDHDVESQVERFLLNQQQLKLSMKADTIAQKQYELARNRYMIGKYDVTKLLLSQDAKDKARENLILTEQNYWLSYFRLRRLALFDFETGQPISYSLEIE
ncbi:MAG: TolC family protein [Candidatus Kapaibacterium sp.]